MTRRRDAIAVGAWVVLRPPRGGLTSYVRDVAEVLSVTDQASPWVHVRFLGDGEERDYEMCELELAAMQP